MKYVKVSEMNLDKKKDKKVDNLYVFNKAINDINDLFLYTILITDEWIS